MLLTAFTNTPWRLQLQQILKAAVLSPATASSDCELPIKISNLWSSVLIIIERNTHILHFTNQADEKTRLQESPLLVWVSKDLSISTRWTPAAWQKECGRPHVTSICGYWTSLLSVSASATLLGRLSTRLCEYDSLLACSFKIWKRRWQCSM